MHQWDVLHGKKDKDMATFCNKVLKTFLFIFSFLSKIMMISIENKTTKDGAEDPNRHPSTVHMISDLISC